MNLDNPTIVPAPETPMFQGDAFPATMQVETPGQVPVTYETPAQPTQPQKIVVGDKVFNTTEEALAYAEGFVRSQANSTQRMTPVTEEAPLITPGKKPGQLIFEDPDQALADVENRAVERMRAEQRTIDENKNFWEDFYLKHSDLKGSELLVDAVLGRAQSLGEFKSFTREQAAPILAAKARQEVSKIRNVPNGGQALPSTPAMVAGSSGASTPRPQVTQPAPTNFVSELRNMRKKG
jgi:hypothetical protein